MSDEQDIGWWGRLLVHVTGRSSRAGADRERRWVLFLIFAMVIGSLALVLVLVGQDLSGSGADQPVRLPSRRAAPAATSR